MEPLLRNTMIGVMLFASAAAGAPGGATRPVGVGALGDSYTDEYQFYGPDRREARNWVEILVEARGLNFGPYSPEDRGAPRHQGFAYNWARSDATTADAIAEGQHLGLARQVARGEVSLVCIFVGGNDFIHALHAEDPLAAVTAAGPRAEANLRAVVETILGASPEARVVLATVPDVRHLPEFRAMRADGRLPGEALDAASAGLRRYNAEIRRIGLTDPRVALVDLDLETRLLTALSPGFVPYGGRRIDRLGAGNSPDHFFLADLRHAGTIGQGLIAQQFLRAANDRFGFAIEPLTDAEVLALADAPPSPGAPSGPLFAAASE